MQKQPTPNVPAVAPVAFNPEPLEKRINEAMSALQQLTDQVHDFNKFEIKGSIAN